MAGSPRELEQGIRQALLSGSCSQSNQSLRIGGQAVQNDMQSILCQNSMFFRQQTDSVPAPNQQFTLVKRLRRTYVIYRHSQQCADPKSVSRCEPPEDNLFSFFGYPIVLCSAMLQQEKACSWISRIDNHPICLDFPQFG